MEQFKNFTFKHICPFESEYGRFGTVCLGVNDDTSSQISDDCIVVDLEWQKDSIKPFICDIDSGFGPGFDWEKWDVYEEDVEEFINTNWKMIMEEADKEGYEIMKLG